MERGHLSPRSSHKGPNLLVIAMKTDINCHNFDVKWLFVIEMRLVQGGVNGENAETSRDHYRSKKIKTAQQSQGHNR